MQRRLICTVFGAILLAGCTNGGDKSPGAAITAQPVNAAQIVVVRQESQDVASDALGALVPRPCLRFQRPCKTATPAYESKRAGRWRTWGPERRMLCRNLRGC